MGNVFGECHVPSRDTDFNCTFRCSLYKRLLNLSSMPNKPFQLQSKVGSELRKDKHFSSFHLVVNINTNIQTLNKVNFTLTSVSTCNVFYISGNCCTPSVSQHDVNFISTTVNTCNVFCFSGECCTPSVTVSTM